MSKPKSLTQTKETALIIDANSLIHRAWHALPPLTTPDGKLVNAAYGFTSVLIKILASERPTYLAVCWDTVEPTYRHVAREEYKAHREEQPEDFYAQFPLVKQIVKVLGGANVELPGYEADDLLATFGTQFAKTGVKVKLLTSDRDLWQVIRPGVRVVTFKKGVSETVEYDEKKLKEKTSLSPKQQIDFKALRGDPSDNLKGVPGIGDKTATDLLTKYKDLDGVFKAAHDPKSKLSPAGRRRLLEGEQEAREIFPIVRLVEDVPVKEKLSDLKRRKVDEEELRRLFTTLGFRTLLARALGKKDVAAKKTTTRPSVPMTKTKHLTIPSLREVKSFLETAQKEGEIIITLPESDQQSLFTEAPALALGLKKFSLLVSSEQLKDKGIRTSVADILSDRDLKKIGHGLKAAWHWAKKHNFDLEGIVFDTQIASYILAGGERGHDLTSLAAAPRAPEELSSSRSVFIVVLFAACKETKLTL